MVKAQQGAYAVFAVTNYWESLSKDTEIAQGKNIVDAAKEAGVQHFIWSSLLHVGKLSKGKLPNVYHFDSKAEVEEYAREVGIPSTFFLPGVYMSNFPGDVIRQSPPDNAWTLSLPIPETALGPLFDTADTGKFVKAAVLNREKTLGKRLLGATEYATFGSLIDGFKKVFPEAGKTAKYVQITPEQYKEVLVKYAGMPDFVAQEMVENFLLFDQFGYFFGESLDETHALLEDKLTTWEDHLRASAKLPADLK